MERDLEERTKRSSLAAIKLTSSLPNTRAADVLARKLPWLIWKYREKLPPLEKLKR